MRRNWNKVETLSGTQDVKGPFTRKGSEFWTQAALDGHTPALTLKVTVLMGELRLRCD